MLKLPINVKSKTTNRRVASGNWFDIGVSRIVQHVKPIYHLFFHAILVFIVVVGVVAIIAYHFMQSIASHFITIQALCHMHILMTLMPTG